MLGIPFYGRGAGDYSGYQNFRDFEVKDGYEAKWDSVAASPYIADAEGRLVLGYESPESAKLKCDKTEEGGDDVKSSCPLCPGLHT